MTILKRFRFLFLLSPITLLSAMAQVDEKQATNDDQPSRGWILVFNGTSSSGKTTLAKKLQKIVKQPIEVLQLDAEATIVIKEMLESMGYHYDGNIGFWDWFDSLSEDVKHKIDESEDAWEKEATKRMIEKSEKLVSEGINVIIDTVLESEAKYKYFKDELNSKQTYFVLVYAPITQLLTNVLARNNSSDKNEERNISLPFAQYLKCLFESCDPSSPKRLDVLTRKEFDKVCKQLERRSKNQDQDALNKAREDKEKVADTFFQGKDVTGIALKLPAHDFVINTGKSNPTKCAKMLAAWLASKV